MRLRISTSERGEAFILEPLDFMIKEIRGLRVYVKNLNDGYIEGEKVVIPFSGSDVLDLYHNIVLLFERKFRCTIEEDENAGQVLSDVISEEEKFKKFSSKALSIRNNVIDKKEIDEFLKVVREKEFKRTLKPFQLLSAFHLAFSQNACNFSVPGSGKTTTVLAAYSYLRNTSEEKKKLDKILVVGPLSSFLAWKKEFYYCFGRNPSVLEITGNSPDSKIEESLVRTNVGLDLILVSYGSVCRRQDILQFFLKNNRTMVVLDEAHRIKRVEDGVQSNAVLRLSPFARSRVILTGTPAPNGYVDLYNLFKFIWPSHNIIGYSIPQLAYMNKHENDERIKELVKRISPFFIRIRKSDLGLKDPVFLPPIAIPMSPVQEAIYDAISKMAIGRLENGSTDRSTRLSAIIRLRQAASNPSLLNKSLEDYFDYEDDSVERVSLDSSLNVNDEVLELIRNYQQIEVPNKIVKAGEIVKQLIESNEQVIVWCEFIGTCEYLSSYFSSLGIDNRILYGKTDFENREKIINEFTDEECSSPFKVVIANPHAVGESISLHKTCHNALYLEQSFNAGTFMQSKDRIHRVGLHPEDKTTYYFIHSEGTIDYSVYDRVGYKEKRMLEVIESQEIPLIANNKDFLEDNEDDVKAIIRGYYEYRNRNL